MKRPNLRMTARIRAVVELFSRCFGNTDSVMRTHTATRLSSPHGRHPTHTGNYTSVIRYFMAGSTRHLILHPLILLRRWCGEMLMDVAARLAGTKHVALYRGTSLPMRFMGENLDYDPEKNLVLLSPYLGFKPSYTISECDAEAKLSQLHVASRILRECVHLYDTYHDRLDGRASSVVKHSIYALIIIRLCVLDGKYGRKSGLNDAVHAMFRKEKGMHSGLADQELVDAWEWIKEVRSSVLAHVDVKIRSKRIHVEWRKSDDYEDVVYPIYTDKKAKQNRDYSFVGSIYITDRTISAVDRIMRKPLKRGHGPEIQLFDVSKHMEIRWQHMIARRFKGSKLSWESPS